MFHHRTLLFRSLAAAAIDSAWTLQVSGYTVSRLRAKIPPKDDKDDNEQ